MESGEVKEVTFDRDQAEWLNAELKHLGTVIVSQTLTSLEMLGLPPSQEEACKKKIKREIWNVLSDSNDWVWKEKVREPEGCGSSMIPLGIPNDDLVK